MNGKFDPSCCCPDCCLERDSMPDGFGAGSFEVLPIDLQFDCTYAVYAPGGDNSLCYVTSAERGDFIASALSAWEASGGMQKWIDSKK